MRRNRNFVFAIVVLFLAAGQALSQACYTAADMDASVHSSLENAATQYFQLAQQGNTAALQARTDFKLGDVLEANKQIFSGQASTRNVYLLENSQPKSGERSEFYCGIYNSPNRVGFFFGSLPAGQYGIVIQDVTGQKSTGRVAWILRQSGSGWNIAGLYPKLAQVGGHDANWFLTKAREYKSKGEAHNAYFYYQIANDLLRPFPAMSTPGLEKIFDEMQAARPGDIPASNPVDLMGAGRTFRVTQMFAIPVDDALDIVIKYQSPDISDSGKTFQDNVAAIKALIAKYPEFREAFGAVVARAVAPNGDDYGTRLTMKDVK